MAGLRRGKEKVVGGGPDARAGEPGRRDEKGQVSQVFTRMAGLAGVVLTLAAGRGQVSPGMVVRNLVSQGPCHKM